MMMLDNVPLGGQMRKSASSYTTSSHKGTRGMWQSPLPINPLGDLDISSAPVGEQYQSDGARTMWPSKVHLKFSLFSIPVEVLVLAFVECVFVSAFAAVLWYVLGGK